MRRSQGTAPMLAVPCRLFPPHPPTRAEYASSLPKKQGRSEAPPERLHPCFFLRDYQSLPLLVGGGGMWLPSKGAASSAVVASGARKSRSQKEAAFQGALEG